VSTSRSSAILLSKRGGARSCSAYLYKRRLSNSSAAYGISQPIHAPIAYSKSSKRSEVAASRALSIAFLQFAFPLCSCPWRFAQVRLFRGRISRFPHDRLGRTTASSASFRTHIRYRHRSLAPKRGYMNADFASRMIRLILDNQNQSRSCQLPSSAGI